MCTLQPEWETPASQPQPIVFRSASFSKPQYKPIEYNNADSQPEEWTPEQESQDSDNDGEMLSLTGFSPADSNDHDQIENHKLRKSVSPPLVSEVRSISDLENLSSALQQRFLSYRHVFVCDSGWHALAFSYFEIFLHSRSQSQVDEEITRISSLNNLLKTAGQYEIGLIQHMINETINLLKDLSNLRAYSLKAASDLLLCRFNQPDIAGAIICHFRLIASSWLAAKSTTYESDIPDGLGINAYRNKWLNAPHQEIDALGTTLLIDVLLRPLRIGFEVTSIGENEKATHCIYPKVSVDLYDSHSPIKVTSIHLLHRHNHFDILYEDFHVIEDEDSDEASDLVRQATIQATRAEFDAYSFEERCQIPETRFVSNLTTFTPQEVLPRLANLRLSESGIDSIPGVSEVSHVLTVHTAVGQETFEPENAPSTGLCDIATFAVVAKNKEQEEATRRARRSRLKETEPKTSSSLSSATKKSQLFAHDANQQLGYATEAERFRLKHIEGIPPNKEPPNLPATDPGEATTSSIEESMRSHSESDTDYESDWEEEEETCDEQDASAFFQCGPIVTWSHSKEDGSMKSILGRAKDNLVECLMKEFWNVANQTLTSKIRTHASPPDSSSSSPESNRNLRKPLSTSTPGKRSREDGNEEPPEQDRDRGSKKPKSVLTPLEISDEAPHFACPYRKHDPRKYNVKQWAACALTPRKGVARVKSHLYQKHRIHQCQRCKSVFQTQQELDMHVVAMQGCDVRETNPERQVEGITDRLKEQLQCRKKLYAGQTELERWQQIYQLLFPNEIVPSPYFEPLRDGEDDEPELPESARLEEHLRREVPRIFRILLDTEVDNELQSIEERLKSRLLGLLEEAQNHALTIYHSPSKVDQGTRPTSPFLDPQRNNLELNSTTILGTIPASNSEDAYKPATAEFGIEGQINLSGSVIEPKSPQHHSSFDSGYYTDTWGIQSSQQITGDMLTDATLVGEPVRPGRVDCSLQLQLQKAGEDETLHDEVWPFHPEVMTMDDPISFHAFATWSQQQI